MKASEKVLQLEAAKAATEKENTVQGIALNALVNKEVKWHRGRCGYSIGLCRLASAHGGIVLVRFKPLDLPQQRPYTTAHYVDDWCSYYRDSISSLDDVQAMRDLAMLAKAEQRKAQGWEAEKQG
jgi:hypothetical protein